MAWSDNMRCLYCDGKLPLYRKITSGQFCSAVHRKSYWQDQERLAVERLHQTHDSLRAYRAPEALEAILGKPAASPVALHKKSPAAPVPEVDAGPSTEEIARSASNTGNVKFAGFLTEDKPGLRAWEALLAAWDLEFAHWPMSAPLLPSSAATDEYTFAAGHTIALPLYQAVGLAAEIRAAAEAAGPVAFATKLIPALPFAAAIQTHEFTQGFLETLRAAELPAQAAEPAQPEEASPLPFSERLLLLPQPGAQATSPRTLASGAEPILTLSRAQNIRYDAALATPVVTALTSMAPLAIANAPRALAARAGAAGDTHPGDLQGYSQPMHLRASTAGPLMNLAIPASAPELQLASGNGSSVLNNTGSALRSSAEKLQAAQALDLASDTAACHLQIASRSLALGLNTAPGCRYDIQTQPGAIHAVQDEAGSAPIGMIPAPAKQLAASALELSTGIAQSCDYPVQSAVGNIQTVGLAQPVAARSDVRILRLPEGLGRAERSLVSAGRVPLAFAGTPCAPPAPEADTTGVAHVYAANAPMNPRTKWQPLEGTATPPVHQGFLGWTQSLVNAEDRKHVWAHAADFWQHAPRDLKLLAVAIPILLGLALRPSLPKVRVTAPASTDGVARNIGNGFRERFVNVRNSVAERAAVSLNEDFRSGLDDWQTRGDLSTAWSFDGNGFVKPGTLALYRPSLGLTDYEMEFLGLIDKKALSWVVRAKDFDNYYVVKLVVTKTGPLPSIGITRYAVIDGKAENRVDTVVRIDARPDMLYRVNLNVHDDTFLLALQGSVVDNWTDSRLKRGGVGFFAPRGEESRLRWLQITHQYDMLGRLCAYLAPYNIPTTNGSW